MNNTTKKIKVLYILDFLSHGGIERQAFDFLHCVNPHPKYEFLFLHFASGTFEKNFKKIDIRYFKFRNRFFIDLKVIRQVRQLIKKEDIKVIHCHNIIGDFYASIACLGLRVSIIRTFHNLGNNSLMHRQITKWLVRKHQYNVAVSYKFKSQLIDFYNIKKTYNFLMVYNGIDLSRMKPTTCDFREKLSIPQDTLLMGMVANFVKEKDQLTVCKALKIIYDQGFDFHFVFAGTHNGSEPHFLNNCVAFCQENGIADRVHFFGVCDDIPGLLMCIDLFVFSSLLDTFGIALIEAMAMYIPCISSDIPPLVEVTRNGKLASLFKTGDHIDLSNKIIEIFKDKKLQNIYANMAAGYVRTHYSIEHNTDEYLKIYDMASKKISLLNQ